MKRRGLFGLLATAPIAAVTGASAASEKKSEPVDKPKFKEAKIWMQTGITFQHGTPVEGWTQSPNVVAQVPPQTNVKNHGSMIMHEGELFIRSEHGEWRKIS